MDAEPQKSRAHFRRIMGFMRRLRSRSKVKIKEKEDSRAQAPPFPAIYTGPDQTWRLNDKIISRIFEFVCPHSTDTTLEASEHSVTDGCMLCDLRDLANCSKVRRQWYPVASGMLYYSIRIDAVHFCDLEETYTDIRARKSRGHEPIDPPTQRLQQLCRTVRENQYCAQSVRYLKLPYMTRESCKADLARTVSVLPNLIYVDLPEGFFTGDPTCHTLRQELQARCPHIRKMKYAEGSGPSFELLLHRHWQELQVLEISKLPIEPSVLRRVLGVLPQLQDVTFADLPWLNDMVFHQAPGMPDFPALRVLTLNNIPNLTPRGLIGYLSVGGCSQALDSLHIKDCPGVPVSELHSIIRAATQLTRFAFIASVSTSLAVESLPPLASKTIRILNYEILSDSASQQSFYPPADSYYQYLKKSLHMNALPALRQLFVRDPSFADILTLAPPVVPFADSSQQAKRGFTQSFEVFSKGLNEDEWLASSVTPADPFARRGSFSGARPLSSYSASKGLGPQWGGEARHSIVVGNGVGGFLAVPALDDDRPRSAGSWSPNEHSNGGARASWFTHAGREKRASRADLWR